MTSENASPALYLLQFTDIHYYDDPDGTLKQINTVESFNRCLRHARRHHPGAQAVLATGDLTHEGSEIAVSRLHDKFREYGLPVFAIPGNHDRPYLLHEYLADDQIQVLGETLLQGWHIVMLDTSIPGSESGRLDKNELERLQQTLRQHAHIPTLVCLHHQPLPVGSKWLDTMVVSNGGKFLDLLAGNPQVRIVLFGHIHQEFQGHHAHMQLLGSPSTCVQFAVASEEFAVDDRPAGYRWLKLYADGSFETAIEWVSTD